MAERRVLTAEDLLALPAGERAVAVRDGFVTDPTEVPEDLLERSRRKIDARIARHEAGEPAIE
jgi:hypothetical protein